jgi:hypothetical protein
MLDPRGPRFAACVTTVVFVAILLTGSAWLALAQTVVFAIGALDVRRHPYGLVYRYLIAPRLAPPVEREAPEPVRFAQAVGLVFAAAATVSYFAGAAVVGHVASGFALAAAFLNAAFGLCLGCEVYLLLRRARTS